MPPLLVLWDIDYTLIAAGPAGLRLYEIALEARYGLPLPPNLMSMAGRTDSSIALEVLTAAGLADPAGELVAFHQVLTARAPDVAGLVREHGRALPGARAALAGLAGLGGTPAAAGRPADAAPPRPAAARAAVGPLVQSVLTGNIPALARVKLGALGLARFLDLGIGAYGDVSADRADLVPVARQNALQRYAADFAGRRTVVVGDTPSDIVAAVAGGARSVAVATGRFTASELADAGPDVVLADLTDTAAVLRAILGEAKD